MPDPEKGKSGGSSVKKIPKKAPLSSTPKTKSKSSSTSLGSTISQGITPSSVPKSKAGGGGSGGGGGGGGYGFGTGGSWANIGGAPGSAGANGLHPTLEAIVNKIVEESGGAVYVNSGFRTYAEQSELYNSYKSGNGNLAARPGTSKHESGLAVDFGGDLNLAAQLAQKYGLEATVPGEPWHFELGAGMASEVDLDSWMGEMGVPFNIGEPGPTGEEVDPEEILLNRLNMVSSMVGMDPMMGMDSVQIDPFNNPEQAQEGIMATFPDSFTQGQPEGYMDYNTQYNPGAGVTQWAKVAKKALDYTGAPQSWLPSLMRRMMQESGGNPRAINLQDSNAAKGTPSKGLMQTIGPTFDHYAGELRGRGAYDPFANIVASIRYTMERYGSGPAGWDKKGGY